MKATPKSVLLGAGLLCMATAAAAQDRMPGSGIRITKDGGEVAPATSVTPSQAPMPTPTAPTELVIPAFDIAAYATMNEKNITAMMAAGDSLEIEIGQLAQSKGTDQRVRDYGAMLVSDHTAHLAKTHEIITDEDVGADPMANDVEGTRLRGLLAWLRANPSGATWDATLLRFQAQHHQNVIEVLGANIKNAHDDDLEDHIEKTLVSLAKHRDAARATGAALGLNF
jgi:predicted outer membrane protein